MAKVPVIIISSATEKVGKTTLALNLAAALWSDDYNVYLLAPHNHIVQRFVEQRQLLCKQCEVNLPMPELIDDINKLENVSEKSVIIADIPTAKNLQYAEVFSHAHTLVSVATKPTDLQWQATDPYLNLIWDTKKKLAARGVRYLNWIAVLNEVNSISDAEAALLEKTAKRLGFRVADTIHSRDAFRYIDNGYCAADMAKFRSLFKMSMSDVYARREILTLTDFLWQHA